MPDRSMHAAAILEWITVTLCVSMGALSLWQRHWLLAAWQGIALMMVVTGRMNRLTAVNWRGSYFRERNRNSV